VSDYCIASDHEVASVCLFSEKPLSEIKRVYLDYQSKTSVALLKILFKHHWNLEVEFLSASDESYIDKIQTDTAGLIIGDRALQFRDRFAYRYDLATAWREMTGLPFVFAVWVSLKQKNHQWIEAFNQANGIGLKYLEELIKGLKYVHFDLKKYFQNHISYTLSDHKFKGLEHFLDLLKGDFKAEPQHFSSYN
jgi:chorismate dehydratase